MTTAVTGRDGTDGHRMDDDDGTDDGMDGRTDDDDHCTDGARTADNDGTDDEPDVTTTATTGRTRRDAHDDDIWSYFVFVVLCGIL